MVEFLSIILALHISWHVITSHHYAFYAATNKGGNCSLQKGCKLVLLLASGWRGQLQLSRPPSKLFLLHIQITRNQKRFLFSKLSEVNLKSKF